VASATNATPIVISTAGCDNASLASATPVPVAHGWTNGTVIVLAGVEGNTAANGTRVATNVTETTAELYDLSAAPVSGNGTFVRYTGGQGTSYPEAAAGSLVTLKEHPRVWLDGAGGALTSTLCTHGRDDCKAVSSNPAYAAMKTAIDGRVLTANTAAPSETTIAQFQGGDMGYLGGVALMYQSTGGTSYREKTIAALNNIEKYTKGFGCVSLQITGCGDSITLDYGSKYMWNMAQAYSIVRSGMTPLERTTFANKMLNDVDDSCTSRFYAGVGTVNYTLYGRTITGTGTQWLTNPDTTQRMEAGDSIAYTTGCTSGYCAAMTMIVKSVESDTSLTIQTSPTGGFVSANVVNGPFWIGKPWASGNCGLVNFISYSGYSPRSSGKTHASSYLAGAPSAFGGAGIYSRDEASRGELYNQNITKGLGFLALAIALADDDPRAQAMLQRMVFWWKDFWYPLQRQWTTGAMQITSKYYATRVNPFTTDFAIQLRNSFYESSMDFTGGTWLKTPLSLWVYGYNRATNGNIRWGGPAPSAMTPDHWKGGLAAAYLTPGSDESKAWLHILKNYTGYYLPAETQFGYANMLGYPDNYLYTDPTAPTADPNATLPLSRNLTVSDSQPNGEGTGLVISRTGWLADSSIFEIHALSNFRFSNLYGVSYSGDPASYKVFKRHYLLAEDYGKGIQPTFSAYCAPNEQSNYMRIGPYIGNSPSLLQRANFKAQIQYVKTPRYWSDPDNAATYAMVDYAGAYQTAAQITFAHRHFAHFKKPGRSEYIIAADAVRTSGGQHKITFLHYPNNGQAGWFENGKTPWPANGTEGNTVVTGDSIVSSAPASRILTKVLKPGGATSLRVYTDNPDGSYTGAVDPAKGPLGGAGQTFRVSICASADGATCDVSNLKTNVLVAHRVVDGTTETANPVELLSAIDPNFIGAQVDDGANSIVAVFPAEDLTLSAAAFTTTHSDAGQYLVSGLTAGLWSISRDGAVITAAASVDSSGTLYWEGGAGAYVLVRTGAGPLSVATGSLPPALLNGSYYFPLVAQGGVPPYQWSVTSGGLPDGLSLSQAGLLSGTATLSGDFAFTVSLDDSDGQSVTQDLMLTVGTSPLRIMTSVLGGGLVGHPYQATLLASGGGAPYTWTAVSGALCGGLSLASDGTISGQPLQAETCSFRVRVTDQGGLSAERDLELSIAEADSLSILTTSLPDGKSGGDYVVQLTGSGGVAPLQWSISAGDLPDGLQMDGDTGTISGVPATAGQWAFTVRLTDSSTPSLQAEQDLSIAVASDVPELALVTQELPTVQAGSDYRMAIQAVGGVPPYEFQTTRQSLPAGMTLSAAGLLSGRPAAAGSYTLQMTLRDSRTQMAPLLAAVPLTVQPPVAGLPRLELADATEGSLLLRYGGTGMPAGQACTVQLGADAEFVQTLATSTDTGGAGLRWAAFGPGLGLTPNRLYYARVSCGGTAATLEAATRPAGRAGAGVTKLAVKAPAGVEQLRVDYGGTAALGSRLETMCVAGRCGVSIPAVLGQPLYYQSAYLSGGQVVRVSKPAVLLAR